MATLTSRQGTELADCFLAFAQAVGKYRYENNLTSSENQELSDLQWKLLNCSDELYTTSAVLVIDEVDDALETISSITKEMTGTYHTIRSVQKAIYVATAGVTLAAAILGKNPRGAAESINNLVTSWNDAAE